MRRLIYLGLLCALLVLLVIPLHGLGTGIAGPAAVPVAAQGDPPDAPIERDYWPTEDWRTSIPEDQDMDSAILDALFAYIDEHGTDIHGIVVVRHGYIVAEAYYAKYTPTTQHTLASIAKSLTSILIGMLMQRGDLESVDQRVIDLFPNRTIANMDDRKAAMTLEDLLTMRAGLDCRDRNDSTVTAMIRQRDWVQYMLNLEMSDPPGVTFNYCNGVSHLLSALVQETTGQTALELARAELFPVLGIGRVTWERDPAGNPAGGWGLYMTPRDMARLGYLYLNQGTWDGQQIVSREWVASSTSRRTSDGYMGYGYQWWVASANDFRAVGAGGQYIIVRPDDDLVVAITSDPFHANYEELSELVQSYIVSAIR
ncbi:MAG: serine hydrolase [Anaerolineae bacterium]|nr:serine hydrolase [Anaerolineae bacterium]